MLIFLVLSEKKKNKIKQHQIGGKNKNKENSKKLIYDKCIYCCALVGLQLQEQKIPLIIC